MHNTARKIISLMEALEDHDDVQNTYSNFNIPEDIMAEYLVKLVNGNWTLVITSYRLPIYFHESSFTRLIAN